MREAGSGILLVTWAVMLLLLSLFAGCPSLHPSFTPPPLTFPLVIFFFSCLQSFQVDQGPERGIIGGLMWRF